MQAGLVQKELGAPGDEAGLPGDSAPAFAARGRVARLMLHHRHQDHR